MLSVPFCLAFSRARIAESLRKRIVIDFELCDFFVLISSDGNKFGLLEDVRTEWGHRDLLNVITSHQMKTGLILVH